MTAHRPAVIVSDMQAKFHKQSENEGMFSLSGCADEMANERDLQPVFSEVCFMNGKWWYYIY